MLKMKKILAVALAATMVLGTCLTALADPVTSGGTDGSGTSEGHLEKKVINVVLPTVPEGSTPFAYTMDPERLIQETDAAKYAEGTTFPDAEGDTGVYFLTAASTYANTSNTLQAINKSSCAITLSVKVKTTQNTAKDITLATDASTLTATANNVTSPLLYLGLKVGDDTTVVSATEQTVTKTIAGVEDNFEVAVEEGAYVYREKESATTWKAMNLSMTGAVGEASVADDTTAPTVNVTWEYAEAAAGATAATDAVDYSVAPAVVDAEPEISSVSEFTQATPEDVVIAFTLGSGADAVEADGASLFQGSGNTAVNTQKYAVDMTAKTITIDKSAGFLTAATADVPIKVVLTNDGEEVAELTGTITIN